MGATVVDRKGASDHASSFLTAFTTSPRFKRILASLIERVTCNLTSVELVLMTSPEEDHQVNGLAEVGVCEIKAQTRILRSQLEQKLGSRIDEKNPLMSWTPRHAANCVSRCRIMDDSRTPDQRRCGNTWKRRGVWSRIVARCPRDGVKRGTKMQTCVERVTALSVSTSEFEIPRKREKRWMLVNQQLWKINNQIHNQCHSQFQSQFGSRAS